MMGEFPEVIFLFVNSGETAKELREIYFTKPQFSFLKKQKVLFVNKQYYDLIFGYSVPHTMVVDKNSNVRFDYVGYKKELEGLMRENLSKIIRK